MTPRADVTAYVLAGGASRRFGRDKARADVDGTTLIASNAAVLRERYVDVRVVSAPDRTYADLGLVTIADIHPGRGPLAGIHAALRDSPTDLVAIAACDLAGLRAEWYAALEAACDGSAAAFRDERWHPVVGVYHRSILPELERRLGAGELAAWTLLDAVGNAVAPPAEFASLRSIDTAEALLDAPACRPAAGGPEAI